MRHLLGLPPRRDPAGDRPTPAVVRVGAGDVLSWRGVTAEVRTVVNLAGSVDVCLVDAGDAEHVVVYDDESARLWEAAPTEAPGTYPLVGEAMDGRRVVRVTRKRDRILVCLDGADWYGADLSTAGCLAEWVNGLGRPAQRHQPLSITPYMEGDTPS